MADVRTKMVLMGNFLEVAAILNPEALTYNLTEVLEPLSLLGNFELPFNANRKLAKNILEENKFVPPYKFDERSVFQFKSLKNLLCGFPYLRRRGLLLNLAEVQFFRNYCWSRCILNGTLDNNWSGL